jgi:hypothetical protein
MTLPYWEVERVWVEIDGMAFTKLLKVTCPRKGCGEIFFIPLAWRRKNTYGTSPCPNCFKTNRIPRYK